MAKNISAIRFYWVFFFFPPFFDTVNLKDLSEITHVPFTKWPRSVQVFILFNSILGRQRKKNSAKSIGPG